MQIVAKLVENSLWDPEVNATVSRSEVSSLHNQLAALDVECAVVDHSCSHSCLGLVMQSFVITEHAITEHAECLQRALPGAPTGSVDSKIHRVQFKSITCNGMALNASIFQVC